jgi:hypothetical protein
VQVVTTNLQIAATRWCHTIGPEEWDSKEMVAYFEQLLATPAEGERASR